MTVSELKSNHLRNFPRSHFFDPATLRFFGQKLSEMEVLPETETIIDFYGKPVECHILSAYGRGCYDIPHHDYYYFSVSDFDYITHKAAPV